MSDVLSATTGIPGVAQDTESAPQAKPEVPLKRTYKVNGKNVEIDSSKVDMYTQLGLSSQERFEEAKKLAEDANGKLSMVKEKKILDLLMKDGMSRSEAVASLEDILVGVYEDDALSPDEKARRAEKAELDKYRKEKEDGEKTKAEKEQEAQIQREVDNFETELFESLSKSSLPKDPMLAKMTAQYMHSSELKGVSLSAQDAVKIVEKEFPKMLSGVLGQMDPEGLKKFLGADVLKKLADDRVSAVRNAEQPFSKARPPEKQALAPEKSKDEHIPAKSFFNRHKF